MSNLAPFPERPNWDQYFMKITEDVGTRSTCLRRQVGAIIVKDKRILATGYNGAPRGIRHCKETGCLREQLNVPSGERHELCRGLHAEQNVIIQAALYGAGIEGGTMYCTFMPCIICTKMLINAGLKKLVFKGFYPDDMAMQFLKESGMEIRLYEG